MLCRAEPYSGHAAFHPFAALAGDYRQGICRPTSVMTMFAVWLALLPRMVLFLSIAWCMMNWKRVAIAAQSDGDNAE